MRGFHLSGCLDYLRPQTVLGSQYCWHCWVFGFDFIFDINFVSYSRGVGQQRPFAGFIRCYWPLHLISSPLLPSGRFEPFNCSAVETELALILLASKLSRPRCSNRPLPPILRSLHADPDHSLAVHRFRIRCLDHCY